MLNTIKNHIKNLIVYRQLKERIWDAYSYEYGSLQRECAAAEILSFAKSIAVTYPCYAINGARHALNCQRTNPAIVVRSAEFILAQSDFSFNFDKIYTIGATQDAYYALPSREEKLKHSLQQKTSQLRASL